MNIFFRMTMNADSSKGSRKKSYFFSDPANKDTSPQHLKLSGHIIFGNFFFELQNNLSFLSGPAFNPPPPPS